VVSRAVLPPGSWLGSNLILVCVQEYIVEDLHGHYEPPTLDAEHADRLRSLNLL